MEVLVCNPGDTLVIKNKATSETFEVKVDKITDERIGSRVIPIINTTCGRRFSEFGNRIGLEGKPGEVVEKLLQN